MKWVRTCSLCGARSPSSNTHCTQCRRPLEGAAGVPLRDRPPSWGHDLVEKARRRAEPMAPCRSCGADNPVRFVRCQSCRRPTRDADVASHQECARCGEWNRGAARFCERCGDALALGGDPARWRPDGCPGCWGDVVVQDGLRFCGTCGAHLPTSLPERRDLLRSVAAARVGGGYRGQARPPELHVARLELVVRDDDAVVWLGLVDSVRGVLDLELVAEPGGEGDGERPETPGSLARLARWVRRRVRGPEEDPAHAKLRAAIEAFATEDEALLAVERTGPALQLRVELRRAPTPRRVDAWIGAMAEWVEAQPGGA